MAETIKADVVVAGAGMIGVASALQLALAGFRTVLIDRDGVCKHTSFGNSGLIQCENVVPYAFPRQPLKVLSYALNLASEAHVIWRDMPWLLPWLFAYWRHGSAQRVRATAVAARPLVQAAALAHHEMAESAGTSHLLRPTGYLKVYRTAAAFDQAAVEDLAAAHTYGITLELKTESDLKVLEPGLMGAFAGAVYYRQPPSLADPAELTNAYATHFEYIGGRIVTGDVRALSQESGGWSLAAGEITLIAPHVVLALGPWTNDVLQSLGKSLPIGFKRGYHMHYQPVSDVALTRPVMDAENGYLITPMRRGIRLTTGAEFARRDRPPNTVQVDRAERAARNLIGLGPRLDDQVWLGARPCTPDLLPIIGQLPGHPGLWLNTAHHHLGLTLGPISARLLVEMMQGVDPFTDPTPYSPTRFF